MLIDLRTSICLPDIGWIDAGIVDVPDGLAAALVYQGSARRVEVSRMAPDAVAALVPPARRRGRPRKEQRV